MGKKKPCPNCEGEGFVQKAHGTVPCEECNGEGEVEEKK